jgi:hypothetical protein|eukprot:SAG31_NODE_246_length_19203_cov_19.662008_3_plen_188_part_00
MAQHKLSLEVPDTANACILRVVDTSVYSSTVPVECPILEVTLPGFKYSVQFNKDSDPAINPAFIANLTACDLEIQTSNCGTDFNGLPDGVYVLKWSVSPNDVVYAEYNHLRITKALNTYNAAMCDLDIADCAPKAELVDDLKTLRMIKSYLEAAKAKVEVCHEPIKGMQLYTYAMKLLNKFNCTSCH